jgi:MmyB-like transcription regulator ligand binding domain
LVVLAYANPGHLGGGRRSSRGVAATTGARRLSRGYRSGPFTADWETLAKTLIQRVHREAVGRILDQKTKDLVADLLAYPDVQSDWKAPEMLSTLPMIPISFVKDGAMMSYFSLVTTAGTPQTIAAQELRVECTYPADDETEVLHAKLLVASPTRHLDFSVHVVSGRAA